LAVPTCTRSTFTATGLIAVPTIEAFSIAQPATVTTPAIVDPDCGISMTTVGACATTKGMLEEPEPGVVLEFVAATVNR
jgi:hypothetical protein